MEPSGEIGRTDGTRLQEQGIQPDNAQGNKGSQQRLLRTAELIGKLNKELQAGHLLLTHGTTAKFNKASDEFIGRGAGEKLHSYGHYSNLLTDDFDTTVAEVCGRKTFETSKEYIDYTNALVEKLGKPYYKLLTSSMIALHGYDEKLIPYLETKVKDTGKESWGNLLGYIKGNPFPTDFRHIYIQSLTPKSGELNLLAWDYSFNKPIVKLKKVWELLVRF
jgi:hypothetical protein